MNNKFSFLAFNKTTIIFYFIVVLFSFWLIFSTIIYFWGLFVPLKYSLGFVGIIAFALVFFLMRLFCKILVVKYEVIIENLQFTIINNKNQNVTKFNFNEITKVHINGWFETKNKKEYKFISIKTKNKKFWFLAGNTGVINWSTEEDLKKIDELIKKIDDFAIESKIKKKNLKRNYHISYAQNYYYQF